MCNGNAGKPASAGGSAQDNSVQSGVGMNAARAVSEPSRAEPCCGSLTPCKRYLAYDLLNHRPPMVALALGALGDHLALDDKLALLVLLDGLVRVVLPSAGWRRVETVRTGWQAICTQTLVASRKLPDSAPSATHILPSQDLVAHTAVQVAHSVLAGSHVAVLGLG